MLAARPQAGGPCLRSVSLSMSTNVLRSPLCLIIPEMSSAVCPRAFLRGPLMSMPPPAPCWASSSETVCVTFLTSMGSRAEHLSNLLARRRQCIRAVLPFLSCSLTCAPVAPLAPELWPPGAPSPSRPPPPNLRYSSTISTLPFRTAFMRGVLPSLNLLRLAYCSRASVILRCEPSSFGGAVTLSRQACMRGVSCFWLRNSLRSL
mmetsp:Transcript_4886/g.13717  ORF Transcript_4886/g.13717 Transcript_4886/m.13717 type:complete len:205 (-) Transcript_4886:203-817(-)